MKAEKKKGKGNELDTKAVVERTVGSDVSFFGHSAESHRRESVEENTEPVAAISKQIRDLATSL